MTLQDLLGLTFQKVKTLNRGNLYSASDITLLLKPTDRPYSEKTKKPAYYLSYLRNGNSTYLSGLFSSEDSTIYSADYKDGLGLKHLVEIRFFNSGETMVIE